MAKSRVTLEKEISDLQLQLRKQRALIRLLMYVSTGAFVNEFSSSALAFAAECEQILGFPHEEVPSTAYIQTLIYAVFDNGYPPGNLSDFVLSEWLYKGL